MYYMENRNSSNPEVEVEISKMLTIQLIENSKAAKVTIATQYFSSRIKNASLSKFSHRINLLEPIADAAGATEKCVISRISP